MSGYCGFLICMRVFLCRCLQTHIGLCRYSNPVHQTKPIAGVIIFCFNLNFQRVAECLESLSVRDRMTALTVSTPLMSLRHFITVYEGWILNRTLLLLLLNQSVSANTRNAKNSHDCPCTCWWSPHHRRHLFLRRIYCSHKEPLGL